MTYLTIALIFIIGLCVGSFLNAVIYRLGSKIKIWDGRSICFSCKKKLTWKELFPVISFIIQKGKCRGCGKKISWQYPVVELSTAILFTVSFLQLMGWCLDLGSWILYLASFCILRLFLSWFIISVLIVVFVYDLKHKLILDSVMIPSIIIVFFTQFLVGENWLYLLFAAFIAGGFFLAQYLASQGKWIGGGDIRLGVFMGFVLGWPNVLVGLLLAYFIGAIIAVILLIKNKKNLKSEIPFGPFLAIGTLIAMFWGQQIISWYWGLM